MSAFTDQILAEKLAKLNTTQQSIETLSHWCIFHRKKATQVVQRWAKNFRGAQSNQRLAFLYLANDIIQNSRRKGPEYVNEFWKVLSGAVNDADSSKDAGVRSAVDRLMKIWEDRKVFGQRDINDLRKGPPASGVSESQPSTKSDKADSITVPTKPAAVAAVPTNVKQVQAVNPLEGIAAAYAAIQDGASAEESALRKCKAAMVELQLLEQDAFSRAAAGSTALTLVASELQQNQSNLAKWTSELEVCEKKRAQLVNLLKEALSTQESKLERVRSQVQVAQTQGEQAVSIRHKLLTGGNLSVPETPQVVSERPVSESNGQAPGGAEGALPTDPRQRAPVGAAISKPESQPLAAPGVVPAGVPGGVPAGMNGMSAGTPVALAGLPVTSVSEVKAEMPAGPAGAASVEVAVPGGEFLTDQDRQKQNAAMLAARLTSSAASAEIMKSVLQAFANKQVAQTQTQTHTPLAEEQQPSEKRQKTESITNSTPRHPFHQDVSAPSLNFPPGPPPSMVYPPTSNPPHHPPPLPQSSAPPYPSYPHPNPPHQNPPPLPSTAHRPYFPNQSLTSPPPQGHPMGQRPNFGPAPPPPCPPPYPPMGPPGPYMGGQGPPPSGYPPQYPSSMGPSV